MGIENRIGLDDGLDPPPDGLLDGELDGLADGELLGLDDGDDQLHISSLVLTQTVSVRG